LEDDHDVAIVDSGSAGPAAAVSAADADADADREARPVPDQMRCDVYMAGWCR
jgi:thioredoxin reductase